MSEAAEFSHTLPPLSDLLTLAGFRVRTAKRADCPSCKGSSQMTVAFVDEVYFCHRCKRTGNRQSLARELGLFVADREIGIRWLAEARKTAKVRSLADRLRVAERRILNRASANLLSLVALRRNAGARLTALHAGARERFPEETEFARDALRFVADHETRASASYLVAAFACERDRAAFCLHPELRTLIVERVLDEGGLQTDRGRWVELSL